MHSAMVSSGVAPCSGVAGGAGLISLYALRWCHREWIFAAVSLGDQVERSDVDSLGSLSGKWAASGVARAAPISSTCQPMFLAAVSLEETIIIVKLQMKLDYG